MKFSKFKIEFFLSFSELNFWGLGVHKALDYKYPVIA